MRHFEDSVLSLQKTLSDVTESVSCLDWSGLSPDLFCENGDRAAKGLSEISHVLSDVEHFAELAASELAAEFREKKLEIHKLHERLEKNVSLENGKSGSLDSAELFPEKRKYNANFASLQHETRTVLLQLAYLSEKALLDARRLESSPVAQGANSKSLLHLLKEKESELFDVKSRQFDLEKKALLGAGSEPALAELELELNEANSRIKLIQHRLEHQFGAHSQLSEKLMESTMHLRNEMMALQNAVSGVSERQTDLFLRLKKESEFAKELAFRIEHETVGLRGKYTNQLLNLNEQVEKARSGESEKFERRVNALEKENKKQHELLDHFKNVVEGKEKTIERLENHVVHLRLLLATQAKHKAAKEAFLKPTQTNKKKKRAN